MLIPPEGLKVPGLAAVNYEAVAKTRELLKLGQLVLEDPEVGLASVETYRRLMRAPHRTEPDTTLVVHRLTTLTPYQERSAPVEDSVRNMTAHLGVEAPDVNMYLVLEGCHLLTYDFRDDPFVDMIMDYFRTHVEAN